GSGGGKGDKGGKGKSFDKGGKGKSFDKGGKSFDKGGKGKSFDKGGKSFDKGGKGKSDKGGKGKRRQVVSGLPLLWLPRPRAARDRRQPAPLRGSSPPARRVRQADAGAALLPPSGTPTAGRRLPTGRPAAPTRLPSGPPPRGSGTAGAGPGSHQQSVQALRGWADAGARDSSSSCHGHILVCVKSCGRAVIGRALCLLYAGCRPSCHYIGPARTCLCSLRCCTGTRWCNCKPKVVNLLCPPLPF
ncbi:unnamed protein product, partial [Prorocentrum cordatum]